MGDLTHPGAHVTAKRLFLALTLFGTSDLGKRASPGFFLSTLDQGLRAPEHPSHQCQGPSEVMGVQNSLVNGTIQRERPIVGVLP